MNGDIPSIRFSERLLLSANKTKALTVVAKLLGRRVNVIALQNRLLALWKPKGGMKCVDIENDYFEISFVNPTDFSKVLAEGPWIVFGHNLTIQPWSLAFDPSNPYPSSIVSWIRIPNLPSSLYHKPILEQVGSMIGKVIKIDERTLLATRGRFAWLAVTVDLTKPLITRILVNEKLKVIEYEALPIVCFHCGVYGHTKDNCPKLIPRKRQQSGNGKNGSGGGKRGNSSNGSRFNPLAKNQESSSGLADSKENDNRKEIKRAKDGAKNPGDMKGKKEGVGNNKGKEAVEEIVNPFSGIDLNAFPINNGPFVGQAVDGPPGFVNNGHKGRTGKNNILPIASSSKGRGPTTPSNGATSTGVIIKNGSGLVTSKGGRSSRRRNRPKQINLDPAKHTIVNLEPNKSQVNNVQVVASVSHTHVHPNFPSNFDQNHGNNGIDFLIPVTDAVNAMVQGFSMAMESDDAAKESNGCGHPRFDKHIKEYSSEYNPDIVALLETRISSNNANVVISKLNFNRSHRIEARGFAGGIWICWNDAVQLEVLQNHFQFVHCRVKKGPVADWAYISFVYGSPQRGSRKFLWEELSKISRNLSNPWLLAGDFNAILCRDEKKGSASPNLGGESDFQNFIFNAGLRDMGFKGPKFTWSRGNLFQRLDRALCNSAWDLAFSRATVYHLHQLKSDHRPLLISVGKNNRRNSARPFHFFSGWLSHEGFGQLVRDNWQTVQSAPEAVEAMREKAIIWNKSTFGILASRKRQIIGRLKGIQKALETHRTTNLITTEIDLRVELEEILDYEELLWKLKSRDDWISLGDHNTKYYHNKTLARRKLNRIEGLKIDGVN
ncbi:uncharacterized protein LOC110623265 [Manihot esculenta]|uniref:uncharacterized protein LOC110623265 n=1 Tax=Manihot esculenta TaxID=3983 RepID=UPI000B5D2D4F|nr:uncharacterized protein LOC110623265 [Manihot esculenta]